MYQKLKLEEERICNPRGGLYIQVSKAREQLGTLLASSPHTSGEEVIPKMSFETIRIINLHGHDL